MVTNVKKKSTAKGNKFSYKYVELATIHEELEGQGITYVQYTEYDKEAGADYVYTIIRDKDGTERPPLRGAKIVIGDTLSGGNAAQQYGSALTYARRYSLLMALGWATEDDDARASQSQSPPQKKQPISKFSFRDIGVAKKQLELAKSMDELKVIFGTLGEVRTHPEVIAKKDELKKMFEEGKNGVE